MTKPFKPSFKTLQKDLENYIKHKGRCDKNEFGQTVYHGYDAALALMFKSYIQEKAFDQLTDHFRKWNWEWNYDDYFTRLITTLERAKDWKNLKQLWEAVIAKRKTNYNKTRKAHQDVPDQVPETSVVKTRNLLLESLDDMRKCGKKFGTEKEIAQYLDMKNRVQKGLKA